MSISKKVVVTKEEPIKCYADFWAWFQHHEKEFYKEVKSRKDKAIGTFVKLTSKLNELRDGYYYSTGMMDEHTAELVLTANGNVNNIVFVEELVNSAPQINGWKFTALKQPTDVSELQITIGGHHFNSGNINFYANEVPGYPDEIYITIVYDNLNEGNKEQVDQGTYLFFEHYLGELEILTSVDHIKIIGKREATSELVPIAKLKDYLSWREKEFIEKYDGVGYSTENDGYSLIEGELDTGNRLLAVINTTVLNWDAKGSHPWVLTLTLQFGGSDANGMPNDDDSEILDKIEEGILQQLKDRDGYLHIGRQTAESVRTVYFACKDFRKPTTVFYEIQQEYSDRFEIEYDMYRDKYWRSFEGFNVY